MLPDRSENPYASSRARRGLLVTVAALSLGGAAIAQGNTGGGVGAPGAPRPADATCIKSCLDVRTVAVGGKIAVTGQNLGSARAVFFPTRSGRYVGADAEHVSDSSIRAKVPKGATKGKPVVADHLDQTGKVPVRIHVKPASSVSSPKEFKVTSARVSPRKSFVGGRKPTATYVFKASRSVDVRVDVTNIDTGEVVNSIVQREQEPFATNAVKWNGRTSSGGTAATGRYKMSVAPLAGGNGARLKLKRFDHIFPLRSRHKYGDGLGAGRGHMGQDIFGRCGKPVVAARGGRVTFSKFQGRAGYYVVIDGVQTKLDYFYAHLQKKGRVKQGQRVRTGQVIGYNGATGNASGCHVHFELWKGAWQQGGKVVNPTKQLKRWDSWS